MQLIALQHQNSFVNHGFLDSWCCIIYGVVSFPGCASGGTLFARYFYSRGIFIHGVFLFTGYFYSRGIFIHGGTFYEGDTICIRNRSSSGISIAEVHSLLSIHFSVHQTLSLPPIHAVASQTIQYIRKVTCSYILLLYI